MRRQAVILALLLGWSLAGGREVRAEGAVSRYDLHAKGMKVGKVQTTRSRVEKDGSEVLCCDIVSEVKVNLLVYKYNLTNHEVSYADDQGVFEYSQVSVEDGNSLAVHGRLADGVFRFSIVENGAERILEIPRDSYDVTTQDGVELTLDAALKERKLRVLDLGALQVVERTYQLSGREEIEAGAGRTACRVIDMEDCNKKIRRWIAADPFGLVIIRQDGRDKAGAYSMRLQDGAPLTMPLAIEPPFVAPPR